MFILKLLRSVLITFAQIQRLTLPTVTGFIWQHYSGANLGRFWRWFTILGTSILGAQIKKEGQT